MVKSEYQKKLLHFSGNPIGLYFNLTLLAVSGVSTGQSCNGTSSSCADPNAVCQQNVCTCKPDFFNKNGQCSKKRFLCFLIIRWLAFNNPAEIDQYLYRKHSWHEWKSTKLMSHLKTCVEFRSSLKKTPRFERNFHRTYRVTVYLCICNTRTRFISSDRPIFPWHRP